MIDADDLNANMVEVSTIIEVNGRQVEHAEWSYTRSAGSEIPGALSGKSLVSASGSITWAQDAHGQPEGETTSRQRTPWMKVVRPDGLRWPPSEGDTVTIDTVRSDGVTTQRVRKFTGKIRSTSGGIRKPLVSQIIDDADRARQQVALRPMQYAMPQNDRPGEGSTAVQLASLTPMVLAMREAGYLTTPPDDAWAFLSVAGAGTFFPEAGFLATTAWGEGRTPAMPAHSKWGPAASVPFEDGVIGKVVPVTVYGAFHDLPRPVDSNPHWGVVDMPSRWGMNISTGYAVRVEFKTRTHKIWVERASDRKSVNLLRIVNGFNLKSDPIPVPEDADVRCCIRIGDTIATLRTDVTGDREVTCELAPVPENTIAHITAIYGAIGFMQYRTGGPAWPWLDWKPSAIIDIAPYGLYSSLGLTTATPQIEMEALNVARQTAKALCGLIWFDENGRFHWADPEALNVRQPTAEFAADRSLLDLEWSDDGTSHRRIDVKYQTPQLTGGAASRDGWALCWQGGGQTLQPGETQETWAEPKPDEDWIAIDANPTEAGFWPETKWADNWATRVNGGRNSIVGATLHSRNGDNGRWAGGTLQTTFERIGLSKILIRHKSNAQGDDAVTLKLFSGPATTGHEVVPWWKGANLPIIRAWGRTLWGERVRKGPEVGPQGGPVYEHDAGRFIQTAQHAESLEIYLRDRLTRPYPVVTGARVAVDARVQIGDKIRLIDPDVTGLHIEGVVYAEEMSGKPGSHTQKLSFWVTKVDVTAPTYGEADAAYQSQTYQAIQAILGGQTYEQVQADPVQ